jgi:hypothetical protein
VPVYLIAPATEMQKREWRVQMAALGADRWPTELERLDLLRKAVEALGEDGDVPLETALAAIGDAESCIVTNEALSADLDEVIGVLSEAAMAWPPYRKLMTQRARYNEYAPYVALKMFLVGWEHGPGEFRRRRDGVPDEVLARLDRAHQHAIGQQALMLMSVSAAAAKKSVPPSKSSPALLPSTTPAETTDPAAAVAG